MPRQHELPHTAGKPGPCDAARDAWLDAKEAAREAADERKRMHERLLDKMLETGVSRIPFVNEKGKRCWLVIKPGTPRVATEKADAAVDAPRGSDRVAQHTNAALATVGPLMTQEESAQWHAERESDEPDDADLAAMAKNGPSEPGGEFIPDGRGTGHADSGARGSDSTLAGADETDPDTVSQDLRTPGQRRKGRRR